MLKKITRGFLGLLLISTVMTFIATTATAKILKPEQVKQWIQKSNVYTTLPNTLINQSVDEQTGTVGSITFTNPIIMAAAKSTLTPNFVQKSTEQIIDGTFVWLRGEAPNPTFSIDVTPLKQSFADKVIASAKERYNALPACKPRTPPTTSDPLTIDCRPAYGIDIDKASEDLRTEILIDKQFLPEELITSASLEGGEKANAVFDSKSGPKAYQSLQIAPFVLAGVVFVCSAGIVLLSETKRKGFKRVGVLLIFSGTLAALSAWITSLAYEQNQERIFSSAPTVMKEVVHPVINAFRHDSFKYIAIISACVVILGLLMLILSVIRRKSSNKESQGGLSKSKSKLSDSTANVKQSVEASDNKALPVAVTTESKQGIPTTAPVVNPAVSKKLIQ